MSSGIADSPIRPYNISEAQSPIGFYKTLFRLHDTAIQHCVPAIVKKYDSKTGIANVLPLVKTVIETMSGETLKDRPEYSVPIRRICFGGVSVSIPVFVGTTGWLIAGDRASDKAKKENVTILTKDDDEEESKNKGPQRPDTLSLGSFSWGFFVPDFWGEQTDVATDGICVTYTPNDDGESKKVKVSIDKSTIAIIRGDEEAEDYDKITLDDDGFHFDGTIDKTQSVVSDIRYDISSHQIQKKTIEHSFRGDMIVKTSDESGWVAIEGGQAVPEAT